MIHFGRGFDWVYIGDSIQVGRVSSVGRTNRNLPQVIQRTDLVLGILHREQVIVPTLGINPVTRSNHLVGSQSCNNVIYDLLLAEADQAGSLAINIDAQRRVIDVLRYLQVYYSLEFANSVRDLGGGGVGFVEVHTTNLNINGRRQSQVEDCVYETV